MLKPCRKFCSTILVLLAAVPVQAVRPFQPRDDESGPMHRLLVQRAGYIFSGTVKAVERIAPRTSDSVGVMRITFQVEQGIRGARTGQLLTIREWAGLWEDGERYRPGQRVMLFLYPPSKLGLTSPVGGEAGRFPVDRDGNVEIRPKRHDRPGPVPNRRFWPTNRVPPRKLFRELRDGELE
jgi:hypothetical protein